MYIVAALLLFLFSLDLLITSLQNLGGTTVEIIIMATANPFTALFIGLLVTAMLQSSSTTTAITVALVASKAITIENAIPIIMGANIGTTITSTIVSLGFISKKKEFKRAVAAGTYHDFFNILTTIILFPLEYYYGMLSRLSQYITGHFFIPSSEKAPSADIQGALAANSLSHTIIDWIGNSFVVAIAAFLLLFLSIILFRKLISSLLHVEAYDRFSQFFFKNYFKAFCWGLGLTAAIRSSTVTTSLVVPLVGKKIVTLKKAVPFILGANIGTTITAFIAAFFNAKTSSAISIAVAHFLFNVLGFLMFYPIPLLRRIPINLAIGLGKLTLRYRLAGFVYILLTFFFIPFCLIYFNPNSIKEYDIVYRKTAREKVSTFRVLTKLNVRNNSGEAIVYENDVADASPNNVYTIYRKKNVLFLNNETYLFVPQSNCWDDNYLGEKYHTCVEQILPELKISNHTFDSVYVVKRTELKNRDNYFRYFISVSEPFVLKKEAWNSQKLIYSEEILSISTK